MSKYLVLIIYLIFISLGLPDSLLGSGWPVMQKDFDVDSSYAGYVSMTISAMTIISALFSAQITSKLTEKWVVIISIGLTVLGLILFSFSKHYWNLFLFAIPYGLGAGSIDASVNNFVAVHYSSRVMNFLHCFYGVGSMISPNIMSLALKYKNWKEGYRWCAYIQLFILFICIITLPLWQIDKKEDKSKNKEELKEDNKEQKEQKQNEESENRVIKINVIKKVDSQKELEYNNNIVETKEDMKKEETKKKEVNTKKEEKEKEKEDKIKVISIIEAIKIKGVAFSCLAFFSYCSGEGTCFLWTSSFFDRTKDGLSKESIASLSTTIFGGLMLGRVLSGLVSEKFGDKKLIRIGLIVECIGIICVGIPIKTYILAIIGYCLISIGMGPIYPSIQHLAPIYFGKEASATVIGLQMAAAYVGTTFMPFIFGLIQSKTSMWAHPIYVGVFAIFNFIFIEIEFKIGDKNIVSNENENKEMTNKENSEGGNIKK
jgi:fucose permease